jgi:hypothetical protein
VENGKWVFGVVFSGRKNSCYDRSTKSHLGISTLDPTDAHLKNNPHAVATHVLVFQVVGLTTRFKEIACIEYTAGATKGKSLWECLKQVIKACEEVVGIEIASVAMDMNNDNVAMLDQAGVSITSKIQNNFFCHPFDASRIIFVKPDDIHYIKNMICGFREKNIVLDSSLVTKFNLSSCIATFKDVLNLYEKQKGAIYKLCPKLNQKVVAPTHFDKMREAVNDEVFSQQIIDAIESETVSDKQNCTAFVLKCFQSFHRITTSKGWSIEQTDEYEEDIKFLQFLLSEFFPKIKFVDVAGKTIFKRSVYAAMTSIKTLIDLSRFLFEKGSPIVVAAFMLSNCIENLFSLAVARNKKQNAVQIKDTFKSITMSNHQEELTNFEGSYTLERNENTNEKKSFLKMIKEESEKENEEKLMMKEKDSREVTSFFFIPAEINALEIFKNSLEHQAFERESEKFLNDICKKECEVQKLLIGEGSKPTNEAKSFVLQLEFAFRKVSSEISLSSDLFAEIYLQFIEYFEFPFNCERFKAFFISSFLDFRCRRQHKNLSVPEAARLASRSQV